MRKFYGPQGSVSRLVVESEVLKSNILGDPTSRVVDVYIPAGQDGSGLPLLVDLVGITSSGLSHTNWMAFGENMPERLDRLIGEKRCRPSWLRFRTVSPGSAVTNISILQRRVRGKII